MLKIDVPARGGDAPDGEAAAAGGDRPGREPPLKDPHPLKLGGRVEQKSE